MYKVFSNGRIIFFTNRLKENLNQETGFFYRYVDFEELKQIIDFFETVYSIKQLFIYAENPEQVFEEFMTLFRINQSVGGLIFNENDEILMVKRWHKWDLPKGEYDESDNITNVVVESLHAECGLFNLKIEELLAPTYYMFNLNNERVLKKVNWFRMLQLSSETNVPNTEFKTNWVSTKELPTYLENSFDQIVEVFRNSGVLNS